MLFVSAISRMGDTFASFLRAMNRQTGWAFSVFMGGPNENGDLVTAQ